MLDLGLEVLFKGNNMLRLLGGLGVALKISLLSVAISIPLGLLLGMLMTRKNRLESYPFSHVLQIFQRCGKVGKSPSNSKKTNFQNPSRPCIRRRPHRSKPHPPKKLRRFFRNRRSPRSPGSRFLPSEKPAREKSGFHEKRRYSSSTRSDRS